MYTFTYTLNSHLFSRVCLLSSRSRVLSPGGPLRSLTLFSRKSEHSFLRKYNVKCTLPNRRRIWDKDLLPISSIGCRYFSAKSPDDEPAQGPHQEEQNYNSQLPATVAVPEVWPHVPVIAINRNIVFPRFLKLIEVCLNCRKVIYKSMVVFMVLLLFLDY